MDGFVLTALSYSGLGQSDADGYWANFGLLCRGHRFAAAFSNDNCTYYAGRR